MMLLGPQINYMPSKSLVIVLLTIAIWKQMAEELICSLINQLQLILFFFLLAELL